MSWMTVLFVLVIAISTLCTILLNSLIAKISKVERTQKEFEILLTTNAEGVAGADAAKEAYNTAVLKYNESIGRFPGMLVAGIFGFTAIRVE